MEVNLYIIRKYILGNEFENELNRTLKKNYYELNAHLSVICESESQSTTNQDFTVVEKESSKQYLVLTFTNSHSKSILFHLFIDSEWFEKQLSLDSSIVETYVDIVLYNFQQEFSAFFKEFEAFIEKYPSEKHKALLISKFFFFFIVEFINEIELCFDNKFANFQEIRKVQLLEKKLTTELHKPVPSVESMSKILGMSVSKFKGLFHELYNTSPKQYILTKKMEYAHQLLNTGKFTHTEVAFKVGYLYVAGFLKAYYNKFPKTT